MKDLMLTNVSLTKFLPDFVFFTDFYKISEEKFIYQFDLSEIYERKNKIRIFLKKLGETYKNERFDSLDSLLDNYLNSAIAYLKELKSEILTQNIFLKLINKNKNIDLIKDIEEKINFLNNLFYGSSYNHIIQRFNFIHKHFDLCFVRNSIGESASNDSIKINIFNPLNINDVVFCLKQNSNKLTKLVVVDKYVNFRFDVKQYLSHYFEETLDIRSEDYYSFKYYLKDLETEKIQICSFNHHKKCHELSNGDLLFLSYEEFEKHINNSQLNLDILKFNNGLFNL